MTPRERSKIMDQIIFESQEFLDAELPADQMLDAIAHVYDEDDKEAEI